MLAEAVEPQDLRIGPTAYYLLAKIEVGIPLDQDQDGLRRIPYIWEVFAMTDLSITSWPEDTGPSTNSFLQ